MEAAYNPVWPYFLTLTYSNENLPDDQEEAEREITLFLKRIRKSLNIRYFNVTEHGKKRGRIHHHTIIWPSKITRPNVSMTTRVVNYEVEKAWKNGFVYVLPIATNRSVNGFSYVAKYCTKGQKIRYSQGPMLGDKFKKAYADYCKRRHEKRKYRYPHELPLCRRMIVLGETKKVYVPWPTIRSVAQDLGVQYAPDAVTRLIKLQYTGVPNGILSPEEIRSFVEGRLDGEA